MGRRLAAVLSAVLIVSGMGLSVCAAGIGEIWVSLQERAEGKAPGEVMLCRVAEPAGHDYRLLDAFGGGLIRGTDARKPELASWLAERTENAGLRRKQDADGDAVFSNLGEGLYLLVQTEVPESGTVFPPLLIPMPCAGQWTVLAELKTGRLLTESPQTGNLPMPLLGAMGLILSGMGIMTLVEKLRKK